MLVRKINKTFSNEFIHYFPLEINQKVQNSAISASKVHSNSDLNVLERTNSTGGRECRIINQ